MVRHKVFTSYYHKDDQRYKDEFIERFGHLFINKSVGLDEIKDDNSTDYIKRLIQLDYISDTSVILVLVGPKTYCRKHVDWEISAGISSRVGGNSGLLGICLPSHPSYGKASYDSAVVPDRLDDNIRSGYAKLYHWSTDANLVSRWIEDAYEGKTTRSNLISNSRLQYGKNRCD